MLPGCAKSQEVTNLNNQDKGSLKFLIENTCVGDTIYISSTLVDETLHIYNEEIVISEDLTIIGLSNYGFTLSGNEERRVFKVDPNATLNLHDLKLIDGDTTPDGGAIYNLGNLILTKVEFQNNMEGSQEKALTNHGTVTIKPGNTNVKE